jgi:hypothetical protein
MKPTAIEVPKEKICQLNLDYTTETQAFIFT